MADIKYLVYDNPQGTEVDFVRDTDGKPRVYDDLDMAQECASNQTNGYVVPLGWDPIDFIERLQKMSEVTMEWQMAGTPPPDEVVNDLIEEGVDLSRDMANIMQQPIIEA